VLGNWRGVIGPRGMSAAHVAFWDAALGKAVKTAEWKEVIEKHQLTDAYLNSGETKKFFAAEYARYKAILTELGMVK
jgi:putative tricarboxylic transport membrane protein